ncbi:MAG: hypothetical protein GF375_06980 [Candidatus Omnitrophica bacterium]|nr:hypothetical protein [Candidatus Omnitrophota bacterium]MBD3269720.1 hypothetical protein [Candidatus Omnitrophota bacterium]
MPKYKYVAKKKDGKTVKGVEDIASQKELVARLKSRGLFIISVNPLKASKSKTSSLFSFLNTKQKRSSIKLHDLSFFARNLSTTLSSGVTLLRSLEIIAIQTESAKFEKILKNCYQDIRNGLSFSEAISKYPNVFSALWEGIVRVGETSGNLPFVLEKLADYLELRMEFERKVKSALMYPAILICVALAAIFGFIKLIFPKFKDLFSQFNIELPAITQTLFNAATFLENYLWFIIGGIVAAIIVLNRLRKRQDVKIFLDSISLKIPILNSILFVIYLERLTSTMYILLDGGLPLVYTIDITAQGIGNHVFKRKLQAVGQKVRDGNSLSEQLANEGIFPILVSEMSKIGEETGNMPEVFEKVSAYYRRELTTKVERLVTLFEPLMIVFMGFVIGAIVISLFLPLFKISTLGGGG